jgi:spore coat polysaccharide biosynthesis protein SpsF (cytidylyltransferase family)
MYHIKITKMELNPNYEQELQEYIKNQNDRWSNQVLVAPEKYKELKALETIVTDDEFALIKRGAIEIM